HDRREPDRGPRVVAEDKEGRAECPDFGQRKPVHNRGHCVLAYAEMQVLSARAFSLDITGARESQSRSIRGAEVGRPAEKPRDIWSGRVQRLARSAPTGDPLGVGRKNGQVTIPPLG